MSVETRPVRQADTILPLHGDHEVRSPYVERNSNMHIPTNTVIYVKDSKPNSKKEDTKGRQHESQTDLEEPETRTQYLCRRIIIGKNEHEEKREKENHKHLNFFKKEVRRHLAEFIGTFFIVFFVAGIQINQGRTGSSQAENVDKGLVSGFLLIGLIYCFGKVSGAHFNPCVTLGFMMRGAFDYLRTVTYIIAQFAGAVSGAAVLYGLFGVVDNLGTTIPASNLPARNAFGIEILITFLLISVILSTAENGAILGPTSGLAVGLTFGAIELWAWNFTGASVNPWRTIGPSLVSGKGWHTYWVYIIGPLVGTILAVLVQRIMVTGSNRKDTEEAGEGKGKAGDENDEKEE